MYQEEILKAINEQTEAINRLTETIERLISTEPRQITPLIADIRALLQRQSAPVSTLTSMQMVDIQRFAKRTPEQIKADNKRIRREAREKMKCKQP